MTLHQRRINVGSPSSTLVNHWFPFPVSWGHSRPIPPSPASSSVLIITLHMLSHRVILWLSAKWQWVKQPVGIPLSKTRPSVGTTSCQRFGRWHDVVSTLGRRLSFVVIFRCWDGWVKLHPRITGNEPKNSEAQHSEKCSWKCARWDANFP